ncbi:SET domain-containing protein [Pilatotrama ljubarskyi]|nr:SET domain-containing protein [Pilatotrama ljubarskyi]
MDLQLFTKWLADNSISLHEGIFIIQTPHAGAAAVANHDEPILHPTTVASIPKSSILSVRSCALAEHIDWVPYGHGATLALSLALYSELLIGPTSRWHPYLQSLPSEPVPIARLWGDVSALPDDPDAQAAAQWIYGTEIQRELQDDDGVALVDETHAFFRSDVQPLLDSIGARPTLHGFLHAYSLVCSRAFLVDAYHGLSMVPVADAFNHAHENHVQLASEFDVCPLCGSLSECPHDRQDASVQPPKASHSSEESSDTVDMVTVRSIPPHSEVFNTYGADLGNASLLARYGFALEGGETDTVTFGWPGSGISLGENDEAEVFREVYEQVRDDLARVLGDSSLVYIPQQDERATRLLSVNSDGQASLGLFVWAVWNALTEQSPPELDGMYDADVLVALPHFLPLTARALVQVEARQEETDDASDFEISADYQLLAGAAEAMASLCRTRIAGMGKKEYRGAGADVLNDVLDNIPPESVKTRLALEYLLSERALLEACAVGWEDARAMLTGHSGVDEEFEINLAE